MCVGHVQGSAGPGCALGGTARRGGRAHSLAGCTVCGRPWSRGREGAPLASLVVPGLPRPTRAPREAALPQAVRAAAPCSSGWRSDSPLTHGGCSRRDHGLVWTVAVRSVPGDPAPGLDLVGGLAAPPGGRACARQGAAPGAPRQPKGGTSPQRGPASSREYPLELGPGSGVWEIWGPGSCLTCSGREAPAQCAESRVVADSGLWPLCFRDGHVEFSEASVHRALGARAAAPLPA